MDSKQFDSLVRAFATGMSRRRALRALAGGVAGGELLAALGARRAEAEADKVVICHLTGSETNPVFLIEVDASAVPAHEAHRDVIAPDFQSDPVNCGGCLVSCDDGDPSTIDTCVEGVCVNTPGVPSDNDDGFD